MSKVHIVVSKYMNNFNVLHQGIEIAGKRVYFHNDPQVSIIDGEAHFNFDYIISNGTMTIDDTLVEDLVPSSMVTTTRRYDKNIQAVRINNFVQDQDFKKFHKIKAWSHLQKEGFAHLVDLKGKVVIKPKDGARGIGQLLVDTDQISLTRVVEDLNKFLVDGYDKQPLLDLIASNPNSIKYSIGAERSPDEGLTVLFEQGYVIQSFVENLKDEYRLLTDHNCNIVYCQIRKTRIYKNGFPQATGSNADGLLGKDVVDINTVLSKVALKQLTAIAKSVIGPVSSIDLFITNSGEWGIFEYCNQFGVKGVPYKKVLEIHKNFVEHLITK